MDGGAGLSGSWTHSFEEDEGDVQVFGPSAGFSFPPARRGRETLEFGAGGSAVSGMPGADDRQQRTPVTLAPAGMNRYRIDGGAMSGQVIEIVEQSAEVLKLRRGH